MSHALWNGQNKTGSEREADRKTREDGKTERRESRSDHKHTKYVGFTTEEAGLGHCVLCKGNNTSLRPCFSRPTERHSVTHYGQWLSQCAHSACMWCTSAKVGKSTQKTQQSYKAFREHAPLPKLLPLLKTAAGWTNRFGKPPPQERLSASIISSPLSPMTVGFSFQLSSAAFRKKV